MEGSGSGFGGPRVRLALTWPGDRGHGLVVIGQTEAPDDVQLADDGERVESRAARAAVLPVADGAAAHAASLGRRDAELGAAAAPRPARVVGGHWRQAGHTAVSGGTHGSSQRPARVVGGHWRQAGHTAVSGGTHGSSQRPARVVGGHWRQAGHTQQSAAAGVTGPAVGQGEGWQWPA